MRGSWTLSEGPIATSFLFLILLRHLRLVAFLAQPFHKGDTFIGNEGAGVAAAHVTGTVGSELHTQAGNLIAAHFLFRGNAVATKRWCSGTSPLLQNAQHGFPS